MSKLAAAGVGIVLISSEVEELLELSHRILVMRAGRIVAEFTREQASEEAVMRAALGATPMPVTRTGQDE
jgi:ABC-type sugar transport system ATPase subunit